MAAFPVTRPSLLEALADAQPAARERAHDTIADVYRAPLVHLATRRWPMQRADAEDLAHDFLLHAMERAWFARFDPARGRFRTFVRTCFVAFAATQFESAQRLKRGGAAVHMPLDDMLLPADGDDADAGAFDREWARSVLSHALHLLQVDCVARQREMTYAVFIAHDVDGAGREHPPSYASLAAQHGIPVTQVTNYLNWARRRLRQHVLDTLRALTATDAEYRAEARALLGVEVP